MSLRLKEAWAFRRWVAKGDVKLGYELDKYPSRASFMYESVAYHIHKDDRLKAAYIKWILLGKP